MLLLLLFLIDYINFLSGRQRDGKDPRADSHGEGLRQSLKDSQGRGCDTDSEDMCSTSVRIPDF